MVARWATLRLTIALHAAVFRVVGSAQARRKLAAGRALAAVLAVLAAVLAVLAVAVAVLANASPVAANAIDAMLIVTARTLDS
jgi:hypothetical protein